MVAPGGTAPGMPQKAPYAPAVWALGGPPVKRVDIPAQTVFMFFFLVGAGIHMKIFRGNLARGHKFLFNIFIFGFCMARVVTSILRLASVSHPKNIKLALAAQIFVSAGVLIFYIINIMFAMRLVRSQHPSFGWHPAFAIAFRLVCVLIGSTLIIVITVTVQSFYTLNPYIRKVDRSLQLYASTVLAIIAILPLPITLISSLTPYSPLDRFGTGRLRTKVIALLVSTTLLGLGAWYRCGAAWATPVPRTQPLPGYLGKAPFYLLNFFVEIQSVIMYAVLRVDLRFHIPNSAKGPGSYSAGTRPADVEMVDSRPTSANTSKDTPAVPAKAALGVNEKDSLSRRSSTAPPPPRPKSQRQSLIQSLFSKNQRPSTSDQRSWRDSSQSAVIRRLGGPWEELHSPTDSELTASDFSKMNKSIEAVSSAAGEETDVMGRSPTRSMFSRITAAPSLPETAIDDEGWTPRIEWEFRSPRRFLSLKKRSMITM